MNAIRSSGALGLLVFLHSSQRQPHYAFVVPDYHSKQRIVHGKYGENKPFRKPNNLHHLKKPNKIGQSAFFEENFDEIAPPLPTPLEKLSQNANKTLTLPIGVGFEILGQRAYPAYQFKPLSDHDHKTIHQCSSTLSADLKKLLPQRSVFIGIGLKGLVLGSVGSHTEDNKACKSPRQSPNQVYDDLSFLVFAQKMPETLEKMFNNFYNKTEQPHDHHTIEKLFFALLDSGCVFTKNQNNAFKQGHLFDFMLSLSQDGLEYDGNKIPFFLVKIKPSVGLLDIKSLGGKTFHDCFVADLVRHNNKPDTEKDQLILIPDKKIKPFSLEPSHTKKSYQVSSSTTTCFGALLRELLTPNILFKIKLEPGSVEPFLPNLLPPFPHENVDLSLKIKKDILFNPFIVSLIRGQMAVSFDQHQPFDLTLLCSALGDNKDPSPYNCVITDSELIIAKTKINCQALDTILSKHVYLSEYGQVRFAGEISFDNQRITVNRNSGSYLPSVDDLRGAVSCLQKNFKGIPVIGESSIN